LLQLFMFDLTLWGLAKQDSTAAKVWAP